MLIMVDVDSTIADLDSVWLGLYNTDYHDCMTKESWTSWEVDKIVKSECGVKIYDYLKDDTLYDAVQPIDGALDGINHLKNFGHRIVYASSGVYSASKFEWLERNGFQPGKFGENYIVVHDKSLIKGDLLIDDRDKNIVSFGSQLSILFDQPWNRDFEWGRRAKTWEDVIRLVG